MNPDVKVKWLEALRSGEYEQGRRRLRSEDDKFCCLGVLCDLAVKEGVIDEPEVRFDDAGFYYYAGDSAGLPRPVVKWSGVEAMGRRPGYDEPALFAVNDNGATFDEIADIIEKEL